MVKNKKRIINLFVTPTAFSFLFKKISGQKAEDYDFSDIKDFRKLLSNERAKLMYLIKNKNPSSLYELAKFAQRDFKAVLNDIKILEKFGFISLKKDSKGARKTLKPEVEIEELVVNLKF